VGGAVVFRAGQFRDGYGQTVKSGRYLRAGQQLPATQGAVKVGA
jgi:N-acyl-D-aspartate/D-glutamate deacylase